MEEYLCYTEHKSKEMGKEGRGSCSAFPAARVSEGRVTGVNVYEF